MRTIIGRNSRRRKELEPSRRLSETTGPRSPCAFRVVFPATEVTKRGARCKRPAAFFTHRAPELRPLPQRTSAAAHVPLSRAAHMFPQRRDGKCRRRCSRRWISVHLLPRARAAYGPKRFSTGIRSPRVWAVGKKRAYRPIPLSIGTLQCWPCFSAPARHLQTTSQAALLPLTRRHSDARLPPL